MTREVREPRMLIFCCILLFSIDSTRIYAPMSAELESCWCVSVPVCCCCETQRNFNFGFFFLELYL